MTQLLDPLTIPLHKTRLIEASAGTGKTYTIAALYLRLILGHGEEYGFGRALIPPEILVVTFTNAATQELRDRIRSRLTEAAAFFRNGKAQDPFLGNLRASIPSDQWPNKAWLLDQAAQWMDEAAIYTIHGWSQRMLRQHAFETKTLFDLELEPDDTKLLEEAACDYWRTHVYPLPPDRLQEMISETGCVSPQDLLYKSRPFLKLSMEDVEDPFALLEKRGQAIESARLVWQSDLEAATDQLRRARADGTLNGNKYRAASLEKWIDQIVHWVKNNGPLPDDKTREMFSNKGIGNGVKKNQKPPTHPAYETFDQLNNLLSNMQLHIALFQHAAREISLRYEREKQNRNQVCYDDLVTGLADALESRKGDRLAKVIRHQFPVTLIDEFQDTDPVQYTTFKKIYGDHPDTGLFLIGDPKQAIYAFRGADIFTYLDARKETAGRRYTLGKNYRSTLGMTASVNRMFKEAADHPDGAFLFKNEIPFEAVAANGRENQFMVDNRPVKSMHWWHLPQTDPINKTGDQGYLHKMADAFAGKIVRLLNRAKQEPPQAGFMKGSGILTPLRPLDMAILVRDGNEARIIRQAFHRRRIKSVYLSDKDSIFESNEAIETLYLLQACQAPTQAGLIRAALATSVLKLSFRQLDRFNQDEAAWEEQVERFNKYQVIWQQQGVLPMLWTLFRDFHVPARLLSDGDGERSLTNLLHLAELLQTASSNIEGEAALIRWLVEQIEDPAGNTDENLLRLESDADVVRVITIHKSKGLEFPLVFLPFICSFRKVTKKNTLMLTYHDEQGRTIRVSNPKESDLLAADRERLAEDLRMLYVALTRAQFSCWLGIAVMGKAKKKGGETSLLHDCGFGYLLSGGEVILTSQLVQKLKGLKGGCEDIVVAPLPQPDGEKVFLPGEKRASVPARTFTGNVLSNWSVTSYSGIIANAGHKNPSGLSTKEGETIGEAADSAIEDQLHETKMESFEPPTPGVTDLSIHTFPRGPQPGTFLHNLLEWAAEEGFETLAGDRSKVMDKIASLCRRHGWELWTEPLTLWLQRLLQTPFMLPNTGERLQLAQLFPGSFQVEMEFFFAAHNVDSQRLDDAVTNHILPGIARPQLQPQVVNGMLKGFIDLTFCHKGRYYVLDYKSNHLGDNEKAYGMKVLAKAMLEHRYDLQYVLYTLAMHRQLKARLPGYRYEKNMGGGIYMFLRGVDDEGHGIYVDKPPWTLIQQLDEAFAGRKKDHAAQRL